MKIFDFNFHLPFKSKLLENRLDEDLSMGLNDFLDGVKHYSGVLDQTHGANLMLFNRTNNSSDGNIELKDVIQKLRKDRENLLFTKLLDFRDPNVFEYLDYIKEAGVTFIKFHSYQQWIEQSDFERALKVAGYAEKLGIAICIDTSYGTTGLYKYDNLKLAAQICEKVDDVPIVLLHSGGPRAIEAMLIADLVPNVYLDTSLTIPFYENSRIWDDLAFSYRKVGVGRVIYGSDTPYVDAEKSLKLNLEFFDKYQYSSSEIDQILFINASEIVERLNL